MSWHDQVVGTIEEQRWLDQLGDTLSELTRPLLDRPEAQRVVGLLRGDWLGHPLHPALTDVPIGCWTASLVLDLMLDGRGAGILTATGSAAAVGTAASGIVDWSATEGRTRRIGVLHAVLNTTALGLQLCSLGNRIRGRRIRAVSISALGLSVAAASAWLGGEMVFGEPVRTEE